MSSRTIGMHFHECKECPSAEQAPRACIDVSDCLACTKKRHDRWYQEAPAEMKYDNPVVSLVNIRKQTEKERNALKQKRKPCLD